MNSRDENRQCRAIERQQCSAEARRKLLTTLKKRHGTRNRFDVDELEHGDVLLLPSELLAEATEVADPEVERTIADHGFSIEPVVPLDGRVVRLHRADATRGTLDKLREALEQHGVDTSLAYLTPNKAVMKAEATPEAPPLLPAPAAARAAGGDTPPVSVSVLDTGVALCGRTDGWLDGLQTPANTDPLDVFPQPNGLLDFAAGHGTFIAGLFEQVDPGVQVRVDRVLDSDGLTSEVDIACALVQTVRAHLPDNGKLVVNLSLGTDTVDGRPPLALRVGLALVREVEAERNGEVLLVAAAGNDGTDRLCWPAAFAEADPRVLAVAALDANDEPAKWSTHGSWVTCSTVGVSVVSTFVTGEEDPQLDPEGAEKFGDNAWASWTGTSFAAPQVAARIASIAQSEDVSLATAKDRLFARSGIRSDGDYGVLLSFTA